MAHPPVGWKVHLIDIILKVAQRFSVLGILVQEYLIIRVPPVGVAGTDVVILTIVVPVAHLVQIEIIVTSGSGCPVGIHVQILGVQVEGLILKVGIGSECTQILISTEE